MSRNVLTWILEKERSSFISREFFKGVDKANTFRIVGFWVNSIGRLRIWDFI